MIVYLETNFILELALGRAQANACRQLLNWSEAQHVHLCLPAFALTEARSALRRRERERLAVIEGLRKQVAEFGRLDGSADLAHACLVAAEVMGQSIKDDREALSLLFEKLFQSASFIPLDHIVVRLTDVFAKARVLTGDGDLLIFASVMQDLLDRQRMPIFGPSLFVTGDHDFGAPAAKWLLPFSCDLLNSYDDAVDRVKESLT